MEIKNFKQEVVKLYSPTDVYLGEINNLLSFDDIRTQIKEEGVDGYYVIRENGDVLYIDKDGRYNDRFNETELYPEYIEILSKLL